MTPLAAAVPPTNPRAIHLPLPAQELLATACTLSAAALTTAGACAAGRTPSGFALMRALRPSMPPSSQVSQDQARCAYPPYPLSLSTHFANCAPSSVGRHAPGPPSMSP